MMATISNEFIEEKLTKVFPIYLTNYRESVESIYQEEFSEVGSAIFVFMQPIKTIVLMHESNTHILFYKNNEDEIEFLDCSHIHIHEFDALNDISSKFKKSFIDDILKLNAEYIDSISLYQFLKYGTASLKQPALEKIVIDSANAKAHRHYNDYEFTKAFENAITPSSKTKIIDHEEIINKVKDPSFQYEFEESIKAYNSKLYLAAAATGGVALESILRILIKHKIGEHALPEKTYIVQSLYVLKKNNIVKGRLHARILAFNTIRNSNAHTNEEPVEIEVVEDLFRIIRDISSLID